MWHTSRTWIESANLETFFSKLEMLSLKANSSVHLKSSTNFAKKSIN